MEGFPFQSFTIIQLTPPMTLNSDVRRLVVFSEARELPYAIIETDPSEWPLGDARWRDMDDIVDS